ncbi:hypothetical protein [Streptomyces sp. NBC_01306]|uniref:hypothetical protein n=1 Tax=Streptomyces sp. NBC_01306 TaxID=2903819 RepID=UPI0022545898|nr:hypothetical protein [Streptomyces sp. NBC_01306]MCX4725828.1 hypothetical protein [Streptomyces sp. NBC_01306]
MAQRISKELTPHSIELDADAPYRPRLGDLVRDLAKGGQIGVVVDLPNNNSASYQLRLPGGAGDWRASSDRGTLLPVAVAITHVTPAKMGDAVYDHRAQQAALPITLHHEDGGTSESVLILTPSQVELYNMQFAQLIKRRESARGRAL